MTTTSTVGGEAEKLASMECYSEFDAKAVECMGGLGVDGIKYAPCPFRESCKSVAYAKAVGSIRSETTLVRNNNQPALPRAQSPSQSPYANFGGPRPAQAPVQQPTPAAAAVPPPPVAVPQQAMTPSPGRRKGGAQGVSVGPGQGTPVYYQAVAQEVIGVLPVNESTRHSKPKRLAAEMSRAGLSAMAQQFASFVSRVPFLPGDEDD